MGEVISQDFGKEDREHAKRLARLLNLVAERDADLLANPGKYFAMACDRLAESEQFFRSLQEVLWSRRPVTMEPASLRYTEIEVMTVDRRDYEAFEKLRSMIEARTHGQG